MGNRLICWLLLCSPLAAQDLDVVTTETRLLIKQKQILVDQFEIDGLVFETNSTEELISETEQPASQIVCTSDAQNVHVISPTAQITEVADRVYLVTNPGKHWILIDAIDFEKNIFARKQIWVEVGNGPNPPPEPEPEPDPNDPPIPLEGFRVVIIHETSDRLPAQQQAILYSPNVRNWLNDNCTKDKVDNVLTSAWRIYDDDLQFTDPDNYFATAMRRPRESLPWIIISNGSTGYEGPLPANVDDTLELLKRIKND